MFQKRFRSKLALSLIAGVPLAALSVAQVATGDTGKYGGLKDRTGVEVSSLLDMGDTITMANGAVYAAGPAYSPKGTCGSCHDYNAITKAYHFRQGTGPNGEGLSDTWSSENQDGTEYKYLANAYGHLLSGGQFGAW